MFSNMVTDCGFLGSSKNYEESKILIIGVPMDYTVSFRPGTRFAYKRIKDVFNLLEDYSPFLNRSLNDKKYYDVGELDLPYGNIYKSFEKIRECTKTVLQDGKKPIFIGGEHLISAPIIREFYEFYRDELVVLHFDAHADLREEYMGENYSHASVMRRVLDFMKPENLYQFGIRSGTKEEFEWAQRNTNFYPFEVVYPLCSIIDDIRNRPIYITLDIDVVDPSCAPGTGTPEFGGISSKEILETIYILKDLNVVGMDIVEVSPPYDLSDMTSILAAKIIRESILSFL